MTRRARITIAAAAAVVIAASVVFVVTRPTSLVLTGIVTTDDVIVSPQVGGQIGTLFVREGDSVTRDELLATLVPTELAADRAYYAHGAAEGAVRVQESEATLRYQQQQTAAQIDQAEAQLASALAQQSEAAATLANASRTLERYKALLGGGAVAQQDVDQAQTTFDVAQARAHAADEAVAAQRAALALARAEAEQIDVKRSALLAARQEQGAATAQSVKADIRLGYSELRAPIAGVVDVRAARAGETVTAGQPVLTLIDPDSLWVRADVEETYIDRVRLGDRLTVRLPSGEQRRGTVFYRGVDADFATQRDVSRSKRDIKTFEIRLRVDNSDRRLAVGMTAYVLLPALPPKKGARA